MTRPAIAQELRVLRETLHHLIYQHPEVEPAVHRVVPLIGTVEAEALDASGRQFDSHDLGMIIDALLRRLSESPAAVVAATTISMQRLEALRVRLGAPPTV